MDASRPMGLLSKRPALKAFIAYSLGISAGVYLSIFPSVVVFLAAMFAGAGLILHYRLSAVSATVMLYISLFLCGLAQYQIATGGFPPTHVKNIAEYNSHVVVIGDIVEEPDIRKDRTYLVVEVDSLIWRKRSLSSSGRIMIKIREPSTGFSFRDRVRLSGYLFSPGGPRVPGGFDFARYLNSKDVFGMMVLRRSEDISIFEERPASWWNIKFWSAEEFFINRLVAPLRQILLDGYERYLPANSAALLAGFVLGERRDIPEEITRLFTATGTLHLMAVSGSNVAIVAGFFLFVLANVNRRLRIIATIATIIFYSFLTRNEPSVVRASVMATIGLLGFYHRPNADTFSLLGFTGLFLLIINPLWLFNVGFQLSFAACAGIIYFVPKVASRRKSHRSLISRIFYGVFIILVTTLAAQIAVLPITAEYFNRLPLAGIIANLPMVPLAGMLTIAGIAFLPFILLGDIAALVFAWPLKLAISAIIPLLQFFANLPMAVINVGSPGVFRVALFFAAIYVVSELAFFRRFSAKAFITFLAAMAIIAWQSYLKGPSSESLTFVDCGPDRAVLASDLDGSSYLWYDCHEEDVCRQIELSLLPYLYRSGIDHIDTVFSDDMSRSGLLAREIDIGDFLRAGDLAKTEAAEIRDSNPYVSMEFILNKRVKYVCFKSDNNSELLGDRHYCELSIAGGKCILAGALSPRFVDKAISEAVLVELPWVAQPYGVVFDKLKKYPPNILVFSPDKRRFPSVRARKQLTYLNHRTWATSMSGSFRFRFERTKISVDYMVDDSR